MEKLLRIKRYLRFGIIFAFFVLLAVYTHGRAVNLLKGAEINIASISDGATVNDPLIKVEGTAKNARGFSINDREVAVSEDYKFSDEVLLLPGYNILTLKGTDKFGKHTEKQMRIVYNPIETEAVSTDITSVSLIENNGKKTDQ